MAQLQDELWQTYNEQGESTGQLTRVEARTGILHGASHVWIWTRHGDDIRVLLQVRAKDKPTWPGYLDISAAGHINYGETPLQTAVREANEEIGTDLDPSQLHLLFVHRQRMVMLPSQIIENEFQWVYGLQLNSDQHFSLTDGEVDAVRWLPLAELKKLADQDLHDSNLVPHGPVYFAELFRAIDRLRQK